MHIMHFLSFQVDVIYVHNGKHVQEITGTVFDHALDLHHFFILYRRDIDATSWIIFCHPQLNQGIVKDKLVSMLEVV